MPTAHTVTSIYNMALDLIVESPVVSPADENTYARWLNRNYTHYVRAALRQQPWNFATELFELNEAGDKPAYQWQYQYDLPSGWLRVLPPTHDGSRDGALLPYAVKRNRLLMNSGSPRRVELVMDVQNPGEWDDLFAMMLAARLANGMAHRYTAKARYVELTKMAAEEAYQTAEEINAFEGSAAPLEQYDILRVRGG